MECKTAQQLASYLAPGKAELDAESSAALEAHLRACPECARRIRFGQAFDQGVARAMRSVPVPPGLRNSILQLLAPPRQTWLRRRSVHRWAAAAVVLITVVVALTWNGNDRVRLDSEQIAAAEDRDAQNRSYAAERWLTEQGVAFAPVTPLDLNRANVWAIAPFQGKKVPMLVLINPGPPVAVARVYVVRSDEFDLRNLPPILASGGVYGHQVVIIPDRVQPQKVAYVVIFYGDSLDPFRPPPPEAA